MVKIKELYDRITGKKFYPITSSEARAQAVVRNIETWKVLMSESNLDDFG